MAATDGGADGAIASDTPAYAALLVEPTPAVIAAVSAFDWTAIDIEVIDIE